MKKARAKKRKPLKLTTDEKLIINYLIGEKGKGGKGSCYVYVEEYTNRFLAVKKLIKKGVIEIVKINNNKAVFRFTKPFINQPNF
jgi:hypothetical protein